MLWAVFTAGFLIGSVLIGLLAFLLFRDSEKVRGVIRMKVDSMDGVNFRAMPDRGLNELLYKPRDGKTELSPHVIGRRKIRS